MSRVLVLLCAAAAMAPLCAHSFKVYYPPPQNPLPYPPYPPQYPPYPPQNPQYPPPQNPQYPPFDQCGQTLTAAQHRTSPISKKTESTNSSGPAKSSRTDSCRVWDCPQLYQRQLAMIEEIEAGKDDCQPNREKGPKGDKGNRGPTGPGGETGPKGERGDEGPAGPEGPVGPRGPQGYKGFKGENGIKGIKGENGLDVLPTQGIPGPDGESGVTGEQGDRGPKGYKGEQGSSGSVGKTGESGSAGAPGRCCDVPSSYSLRYGRYSAARRQYRAKRHMPQWLWSNANDTKKKPVQ